MDLSLRSALVTGANRGIGLHTVHALLDAGVTRVYAGARDPDTLKPLTKQYGDRVVPLELDITKTKLVTAAAKTAKDVTILINNAGVMTTGSLLDKDAPKNLKAEWDTNVTGLLYMARAFAPILEKNNGGVMVNLNSVVSLKPFPGLGTYSVSKAAALSLTLGLRSELESKGILVMSVFPGPVDTDMTKDLPYDKASPSHIASEIIRAIRDEHAFLFPDGFSLSFWHQFEAAPGTVLASVTRAE